MWDALGKKGSLRGVVVTTRVDGSKVLDVEQEYGRDTARIRL